MKHCAVPPGVTDLPGLVRDRKEIKRDRGRGGERERERERGGARKRPRWRGKGWRVKSSLHMSKERKEFLTARLRLLSL